MYARKLGENTVTLGVSGKLLDRAVIFFDRETNSEWSQLTAKAIKGKLEGQFLKRLPVIHTTWGLWKKLYPETEVLQPVYPLGQYRSSAKHYAGYFAARKADKLLAYIAGKKAHSWPFKTLRKSPVINDTAIGEPVLVVTDSKTDTALLFARRVGDQVLTFKAVADGTMVDAETGTIWNRLTGIGQEGKLKGKGLTILPATHVYPAQWRAYFPAASEPSKSGPSSRPASRPVKKAPAKKKRFL